MSKLSTLALSLLFILLNVFLVSCNSADRMNSKLQGEWKIIEAYRNGRKTSTMENVYFRFWNNDSIQTNIPISETLINSSYEIDDNNIVLSSELGIFNVNNISNDTLHLRTTISDYLFSFLLLKE